jgi:hypothetical protein
MVLYTISRQSVGGSVSTIDDCLHSEAGWKQWKPT